MRRKEFHPRAHQSRRNGAIPRAYGHSPGQLLPCPPETPRLQVLRTTRKFGHVHVSLAIERHIRWPLNVVPHVQQLAVTGEDLYPVILAVAHQNAILAVNRNAVRYDETTCTGSEAAPGAYQLTVRGESVHATIPVAVADE